jgi:hypothetical protein
MSLLGSIMVVSTMAGCGLTPTITATIAHEDNLEALPTPTLTAAPTPTSTPTPTPTPKATPKPTKKPTPKPPATTKPPVTTVWDLAPGGTGIVGPGTKGLIRYRVEVEHSTNLSAATVAAIVDSTLAGSRGWTNEGWAFQRVTTDQADMTVRVATPATVDRLCAPLNTAGVVSCRTGNLVLLNLTRWNTGTPDYKDDIGQYRILVVNHEVGHRLGHAAHPKCPGAGVAQPVMMQVYYEGLAPCVKNVWPYAEDGTWLD